MMGALGPIEGQPLIISGASDVLSLENLNARLDIFEAELQRVKAVQDENVPLFKQTLKRIAGMRTTIHAHSNALQRLEGQATENAKVLQQQNDVLADIKENVTHVATWIGGAKGMYGFAKKWGPRTVIFATGVLSAGGFGNPKILAFITQFFGG